jgi:hypothetical protein
MCVALSSPFVFFPLHLLHHRLLHFPHYRRCHMRLTKSTNSKKLENNLRKQDERSIKRESIILEGKSSEEMKLQLLKLLNVEWTILVQQHDELRIRTQ